MAHRTRLLLLAAMAWALGACDGDDAGGGPNGVAGAGGEAGFGGSGGGGTAGGGGDEPRCPDPAGDANCYVAHYEVPLDIPVPTGSPTCEGVSGPNGTGEYIIRDHSGWDQINAPDIQRFFVCPGDYRSYLESGVDEHYRGRIRLFAGGTPQAPRYIVWWSDRDYDSSTTPVRMAEDSAGEGFDPGALGPADQAILGRLWLLGADHVVIDRLSFAPTGNGFAAAIELFPEGIYGSTSSNDHVVFNRILVDASGYRSVEDEETYQGTTSHYGVSAWGEPVSFVLQNSVVRDCHPNVHGHDSHSLHVSQDAQNARVVNNEFRNCKFLLGTNGDGHGTGHVIENNDFYFDASRYLLCEREGGIQAGETFDEAHARWVAAGADTEGACVCAEGMFTMKDGSVDPDSPVLVLHNRMWGGREEAWAYDHRDCGGSGSASGSVAGAAGSRNIVYLDNIFADSEIGYGFSWSYNSSTGMQNGRSDGIVWQTLAHNLFHDIRDFYDNGRDRLTGQYEEWEWNQESSGTSSYRAGQLLFAYNTFVGMDHWLGGATNDLMFAANLMIDAGDAYVQSLSPFVLTRNQYVGQSELPSEDPEGVHFEAVEARLERFCYWRRLQSRPEQICVERAVPQDDSPLLSVLSDGIDTTGYGVDGYALSRRFFGFPGASSR